jgi:hypothetical protein
VGETFVRGEAIEPNVENHTKLDSGRFVVVRFICVFFVFIGILFFGNGIRHLYRGIASRSWPEIDGTIVLAKPAFSHDDKHVLYIEYRYEFDGKKYLDGQAMGLWGRSYLTIKEQAKSFPVGHIIKVSVNPSDPSDSLTGTYVFYLSMQRFIVGAGFCLVGFGIIYLMKKGRQQELSVSQT